MNAVLNGCMLSFFAGVLMYLCVVGGLVAEFTHFRALCAALMAIGISGFMAIASGRPRWLLRWCTNWKTRTNTNVSDKSNMGNDGGAALPSNILHGGLELQATEQSTYRGFELSFDDEKLVKNFFELTPRSIFAKLSDEYSRSSH